MVQTKKVEKDQAKKTKASYEETVKKIEGILKYESDLRRVFSQETIQNVRQTFQLMRGHLKMVIDGKAVPEVSQAEKSSVEETLRVFANIAIERPIMPIFRDLARSYILLVRNWERATGKPSEPSEVGRNIRIIHSIIETQLSLFETVNLLKVLLDRARTMQHYEPPAFELSRAYLDSLRKHLEETQAGKEAQVKRKARRRKAKAPSKAKTKNRKVKKIKKKRKR